MKHCILQWFLSVVAVAVAYIMDWQAINTFIAGAIFGASVVMTAVTVWEAKE